MGEVYRARDTRLGRDVAIKVAAERFSDRFEREAQAVGISQEDATDVLTRRALDCLSIQ